MARYSIGIDLGTTHCEVSYFELQSAKGRGHEQTMLAIPQVTAIGTIEARTVLPSFLYLPNAQEFPAGSLGVPWDKQRSDQLIGEFARAHGSKVPARLVSSAKSWLCHSGVDRQSPILPWQAPADVKRVSPLEASSRYLSYMREAWNFTFPNDPMDQQEVVITVPASFDASARELTQKAALQAGLANVTLIEEPQAALYAWCEAMGESFRKHVHPGEVILVVDVGGGTSDFSLISVEEMNGEVQLTRIAVGDHILLGGDNMDLALAHSVNLRLTASGKKLDAWQFNALTFACRQAKEQMYADSTLQKVPLVVPGRGSSLIGGTIKTELLREELDRILTDGFFPKTAVTEMPQSARRVGLTQMALPYAQDAAVTRHLAAFLTRQAKAMSEAQVASVKVEGRTFIHPTAVLFNGGVFKAGPLKERSLEVINTWLKTDGGSAAKELEGAELDLAVARGAAYYGWVRHGHGLRIRGGTARAYYVGVETAMPAVPGMEPPVKALCVAPFGMEEGTQAEIPPQEFGLVVGEPTRFRFFASSVRRSDHVGQMIDDVADEFEEVSPVETTLPAQKNNEGKLVPVNLRAAVTELGTLELHCLEKGGDGKWKLELNVRMKD